MKLEYKIIEQDFLDFQLFTASKSDRIKKKKTNSWILLTAGSIMVAFYFYFKENTIMTIYFGLVAVACGLYFPKYFKWRYKKYFKIYIKENYSNRFGHVETIEINNDSIFSKDKTGEGKINLSEIEKIDETDNHFFLKISTGLSLIIPKRELEKTDELKSKFKDLGLTLNNETNWMWK
ncbi:MAG: YcxB family protein [Bacteroidales bacterium]|nr:YcxB family protein [Bacteroidales bacterium]